MVYIVLDLELNQAFPFKTGRKTEPVPECPFEIIQIGAVKLDENYNVLGTFNQMIHPRLYPRLHPFVEKITGITKEKLKDQPPFPDAYRAFLKFIGDEPAILCTWGGDDIKCLFRNIYFYNLDAEALTDRYINLQPFAAAYLHHETGNAIGLKKAVVELGLPEHAAYHDALNDAAYTADVFRIVHPDDWKPDIFQPASLLTKKTKRTRTNMYALLFAVEEKIERKLTEEEKKLVKMAYLMGKNHMFDVMPSPKKRHGKGHTDTHGEPHEAKKD